MSADFCGHYEHKDMGWGRHGLVPGSGWGGRWEPCAAPQTEVLQAVDRLGAAAVAAAHDQADLDAKRADWRLVYRAAVEREDAT